MGDNCLLCGGDKFKPTIWGGYNYKGARYRIVRCCNCNFKFLDPLPGKELLDAIYSGNEYFDKYCALPEGIGGYIESIDKVQVSDDKVISLLKKHKNGGCLLEIGCAGGRFLSKAKAAGYEAFGVEPNLRMAVHARKVLGLSVECAKLDEFRSEKSRFDIIYASDVLEHILELTAAVNSIKDMLKEDGVLVLKQPLVYNSSLFNMFLMVNMMLKSDKFTTQPPTHLWEFDSLTLKRFLRLNGFKIKYCRIIEGSAKPLTVYSNPGIRNFIGHSLKNLSSRLSNLFLGYFGFGDRAIIICSKG